MASITALTTLAEVKLRLEIPVSDTSEDVELALIIAAVDIRIYEYCNRNFTNQTYVYRDTGTNDDIVFVPNPPINDIFYKATGSQSVITITYTGSSVASLEVVIDDYEQIFQLKLIETTAVSQTVTLTAAKSINDIAVEIQAFANWTAVVEANYDVYPSLSLLADSYQTLENNDQLALSASVWPMKMSPLQKALGLYTASANIPAGKPFVVIYDGGFATIPLDLKDAATQISVNTYNLSQQDQNLQSEKIGDYAWARATGDFLTQVLPSWYTVLSHYKNPSMG